ncbi:MAG: FHA domain-containing protein [Candidatus Hydrogenedentes bacterium]|nr:FHA domain-containing protein [Candidatus Hydrogenedentota bacterium]
MHAYELVLNREGAVGRRYRITPGGLLIGRAPESDIVLQDQMVSRRHARVWVDGETVRVQDLGSRNGIEVNGAETKESVLQSGDTLRVANYLFGLARYSDSTMDQTVISFEEAAELCNDLSPDKVAERLPVLYRAARLLGSVFDVDELLQKILALIFEALPVRRGFILVKDPRSNDLCVRASLMREGRQEGPPMSHTLVEHVMRERQGIMTVDAQDDARFEGAMSVMGHQIHAAMCAPLCGRESVAGAIYVDSGSTGKRFQASDLELLTAVAHVVGVAVENARLYQEKVEQEKLAAIGQATAGLGHCMKNILTGIRGGAEYVDMSIKNDDISYVKRAWPIMARAIQRIDMLVMNLLTFSRDRAPERLMTDLNSLTRDVLEVVRARAEKYKIAVAFRAEEPCMAHVDAQHIYRVLLNLVTNALDACEEEGGTVSVACRREGNGCYIEVQDSGRGIPPEIMSRLGQAFVSSKGSAGTGLGLAVSFKIVREHGGDIEVESEPGKGARFSVFLPFVAADAGARRRTEFVQGEGGA